MRLIAFIGAVAILTGLGAAAAAPAGPERVAVAGSSYVHLAQWGARFGMAARRNTPTGSYELTNASARLEFSLDSRKARIGGQTVMLSLPVIDRGGEAMVSVIDAQTALEPLLSPKNGGAVKVICLDPGHGGKDTGKIAGKNLEKNLTLLLAREVGDLLKARGFKVVLTRDRDKFVELSERTDIARRAGADLFVSLHYNSATPDIQGLEVYCLAPSGVASSNAGGGRAQRNAMPGNLHDSHNVLLAFLLQRKILLVTQFEDRGLKRARFEVLRDSRIPAVLIEGGFMTHPADSRKIYDTGFRKKMAQSIVDGIAIYKETVETRR